MRHVEILDEARWDFRRGSFYFQTRHVGNLEESRWDFRRGSLGFQTRLVGISKESRLIFKRGTFGFTFMTGLIVIFNKARWLHWESSFLANMPSLINRCS